MVRYMYMQNSTFVWSSLNNMVDTMQSETEFLSKNAKII